MHGLIAIHGIWVFAFGSCPLAWQREPVPTTKPTAAAGEESTLAGCSCPPLPEKGLGNLVRGWCVGPSGHARAAGRLAEEEDPEESAVHLLALEHHPPPQLDRLPGCLCPLQE